MFLRRPLVWIAVCTAIGVLLGSSTLYQQHMVLLSLVPLGMGLLGALFGRLRVSSDFWQARALQAVEGGPGRRSADPLLFTLGMLFIAGAAYRSGTVQSGHSWAEAELPPYFDVRMEVLSPPEENLLGKKRARWNCTARLLRINGEAVRPVQVRVRGFGALPFFRGDLLSGRCQREGLAPPTFPGAFDLKHYLHTRDLSLALTICRPLQAGAGRTLPAYRVDRDDSFVPMRLLDTIRHRAIEYLLALAPGSEGRILAVAMFGYRVPYQDAWAQEFKDIRNAFRSAGIGHVLAISGLHVGLVVGLAWAVCSVVFRDRRQRAVLCILLCLVYLGLTGGRTAAVRASIMAVLYLTGFVLSRRSDFTNSLGLAAIIVLFLNPCAVSDIGFLLSFGAVLFISRLAAEYQRYCDGRQMLRGSDLANGGLTTADTRPCPLWQRVCRATGGLLFVSTAAWAGVWPLCAYAFHQVHPMGLVVNLFVLPLMSLVLAGGGLCFLTGLLPGSVGPWMTLLCISPVHVLIQIAHQVSRQPFSSVAVMAPPFWAVILYYAAFCAFFVRRILPSQSAQAWLSRSALILGGVSLAVMCQRMAAGPHADHVRMHLLPCDSGEAVIVELPDQRLFVMGRMGYSGLALGRYLRSLGRTKLDGLVWISGRTQQQLPQELQRLITTDEFAHIPSQLRLKAGQQHPRGWEEVPGADSVRMARSYDREGRLVTWSVRVGKVVLTCSEECWPGQLVYRLKRPVPGMKAEVVCLRLRGVRGREDLSQHLKAKWVLTRKRGRTAQGESEHDRMSFGMIRIDTNGRRVTGLQGYDGRVWVPISTRSAEEPTGKGTIVP